MMTRPQFLLVQTPEEGIEKAKEFLYQNVDEQTLLLLSGGSTPKPLYEQLAKEQKILAGAVALIDERYGEKWHANSNEKMMKNTGLFDYFLKAGSEVSLILRGENIQDTNNNYNQKIKFLFEIYQKRVACMGIGSDGHTAGIAPNLPYSGQPVFYYEKEGFGKRITLSFKALEQIDQFVVLVLGENKKAALLKMLEPGSEEEIPARFYTRPEIAKRTLFITDQKI